MYKRTLKQLFSKNLVYKSCCIITSLDSFTCVLFVFFHSWLKIYLHMHIVSITVPMYVWLLRYLNYHTKNIPFFIVCVHRNYVSFSMLIPWMSGRRAPMGRNLSNSYAATFWLVDMEVVVCDTGWGKVSVHMTKKPIMWMVGTLIKPF